MSIKHTHETLFAAWVLLGVFWAHAQAPQVQSLPNELDAVGLDGTYSATMETESGGSKMSGRIVRKGKNSRMTLRVPGESQVMTVLSLPDKQFPDGTKGITYILMPQDRTYVRIPAQQQLNQKAEAASGHGQGGGHGHEATVVGSEMVDGEMCVKKRVSLPDASPDASCFIWCSPKNQNKAVKIEQKTASGSSVIRMKNYDFTPPDDALFRIPDGYKLANPKSPQADAAAATRPPTPADMQRLRQSLPKSPSQTSRLPTLTIPAQ